MRTATVSVPAPVPMGPAEGDGGALAPGGRLGPYELLCPLASGGMGHVWSAVRIGDFGFRRTVAIKVMREELAKDPEFRRMFLDEARLASRVSHTNVVEVLDLGESGGVLFQAMALVDGDSLSRLIEAALAAGTPPAPAVTARIVIDLLRGLHSAHELRGEDGAVLEFVHRDVSPQNILVGLDGVTKITDFGVAKAAGAAMGRSQSGPRGKLAYMPPEQLFGDAIDRRCDVFATGVVLWELLSGRRAVTVQGETAAGQNLAHPSEVSPAAPRALGDVAMRAANKDKGERYATAEEMADALEHAAHDGGLALSAKSVAAWVGSLASERILQRRADTEAQLAKTTIGTTTAVDARAVDASVADAPKRPERKARRVGMAVGAGATAIAALFAARLLLARAPATAATPPTAASAHTAATATPTTTATAAPTATAATALSTATATAAPVRERPGRPARPAKGTRLGVDPAPSARPKYDNPY